MPSQYDNTFHHYYSKPVYDTDGDRHRFQAQREFDAIMELQPPSDPTPEDEMEYINWLEQDMMKDPVVHPRYSKYRAGPKRIPYRNTMELRRQWQLEFATKMAFGSALAWPIAVMVGNWSKRNSTGVPVVHYPRYKPDWPNVNPTGRAAHNFKRWSLATALFFGFCFATYTTDRTVYNNKWYNRPDIKPFPAMVKNEESVMEKTAMTSLYNSYRKEKQKEERKKGAFYRFLWPCDADFTPRENPYAKNHHHDVYNPQKGYYKTYTNSFMDHLQE